MTAHLDALALVQQLRGRLVDFGLDANYLRNSELMRILKNLWSGPAERGGLVSDLWVEAAFPPQSSAVTLGDLASRGEFNRWLTDQLDQSRGVPRPSTV